MTTATAVENRRNKREPKLFSRSVSNALRALEFLRRTPRPVSLHEVSLALKGAKTSIFRLLNTLEASGYIVRDGGGLYTLSSEAHSTIPSNLTGRILRDATPRLREIVRQFQETASLALLFNNHIEAVAVVESPQMIRMGNIVGRIIPPHASSLGKAITAFQPEERRERLLRSYGIYRYTENTITDERALREEFEEIRERGYAAEREESELQGCCFGVPLLDENRFAFGAISISMPVMRMAGEQHERDLVAALRTAADQLSSTALLAENRVS